MNITSATSKNGRQGDGWKEGKRKNDGNEKAHFKGSANQPYSEKKAKAQGNDAEGKGVRGVSCQGKEKAGGPST